MSHRDAGSGPAITIRWAGQDHLWPVTVGAAAMAAAALAMARLGIPSLPTMAPMDRIGIVAPSCGLTRGVVALARGDFVGAWRWNPASIVVAIVALAAGVRHAFGIATGRWLQVELRPTPRFFAVLVVMISLLWLRQQASAALLMEGR